MVFTCYLEILKCINDWVAELVYFLHFCPVQFQSVWVLFPSQYFATAVQCCLYELLLGQAWDWLCPAWPHCGSASCDRTIVTSLAVHQLTNTSVMWQVLARQITPITQCYSVCNIQEIMWPFLCDPIWQCGDSCWNITVFQAQLSFSNERLTLIFPGNWQLQSILYQKKMMMFFTS